MKKILVVKFDVSNLSPAHIEELICSVSAQGENIYVNTDTDDFQDPMDAECIYSKVEEVESITDGGRSK